MLCAVRGIGRTLDFAIQEAKDTDRPLYVLFVREQPVIAPDDRKRKWVEDDEARTIFLVCEGEGIRTPAAAGLCHQRLGCRHHRRHRGDRRRVVPDRWRTAKEHVWSTFSEGTLSGTFPASYPKKFISWFMPENPAAVSDFPRTIKSKTKRRQHPPLGLVESSSSVTSQTRTSKSPMLHIIWSIILGFIAGAIAKVIMHTHLDFILTTLLGIVGSIVGGLIARLFSKPPEGSPFHPAGLILSIIGAIIVLFIASRL